MGPSLTGSPCRQTQPAGQHAINHSLGQVGEQPDLKVGLASRCSAGRLAVGASAMTLATIPFALGSPSADETCRAPPRKVKLAKANWLIAEHGEKLLILLEFFCRRDRLPTPQPIRNAVL